MTDRQRVLQHAPIEVDVGRSQRPHQARFTRNKRIQFLEEYAEDLNFSRAAHVVGLSRRAIYKVIEKNEQFAEAVDTIKQAYLDQIEAASFHVGSQLTREGFNDRKLLLQAHRRETYGDRVEVSNQVKVTTENAFYLLQDILDGIPRRMPERAIGEPEDSEVA